jgi:glycerol-3-phosphate dehydrogenase
VDEVLGKLHGVARRGPQVRLVKGSHIVVPKLYDGDHAYTLQHPDGRVVFTIPYEDDYTAVGTTDVPFTGDAHAAAISAAEATYLCDTVNRYFPSCQLLPQQVVWSYAGVRPLFDDTATDASKVTRDYRLERVDAGGALALCVYGGKITTYRKLAEAALVQLQLQLRATRGPWTADSPLPGGDLPERSPAMFLEHCRRRWPRLPGALLQRLVRTYGTRIERVLGGATSLEEMGRQHGAGLTDMEVDYLRRHEWAQEASDILWRRTKLGLHMTQEERAAFTRICDATPAQQVGVG